MPGQLATGIMVNPPAEGDASHARHVAERGAILASLSRRADVVQKALDALDGVSCNRAQGAMYLFPQLHLPPGAVAAAETAGKAPDVYYCIKLLEATGLVVVPGSGFGQRNGTFHFRTTFLPPEDEISSVLGLLESFHSRFMAEHGAA